MMGEYSYVTVEFNKPDDWPDTIQAVVVPSTNWDGTPVDLEVQLRYDEYQTSRLFQAEWEQARYGFDSDEDVQALVGFLTAEGIPWTARDGGGYEWPEAEYAWHPDYGVKSRTLDGTGEPVLMAHQFRVVMDTDLITEAEKLAAIAEHFDTDPTGWL